MPGQTNDLISVVIFILCFLGGSLAEAFWLQSRKWGSLDKSMTFAFTTNTIGLGLGFFISFVGFGALMAETLRSSAVEFGIGNLEMWLMTFFALVLPPLLLLLCKKRFLRKLRMRSGSVAWTYSVVASLLMFFFTLAAPQVILYFF